MRRPPLTPVVFAWLLASAPFLPAQNYLHTSGAQLLDSKGAGVRITGLNWFGLETSNYCPHGLWVHSMGFYLDLVKAQGYNCLRLPYCSELFDSGSVPNGIDFSQNADLAGLTGLQIMDKVVSGCQARGIKIILDRHRPDSGAQSALWYTSTYPESRWISDWQMLAQRYLGNDTVIGCDLHNEPHFPATWGDGTADDWVLAAERCGNAILSVNPHLLIVVEGTDSYGGASYWWGGQLAGAAAHPVQLSAPHQLVYSTHDYPASVYAQPWFSAANYPANLPTEWDATWAYLVRTGAAPVLIGEFGSYLQTVSDQEWFTAIASEIKGKGLSFTFWCLNPDSGDTGGLLENDWTTVVAAKQQVLAPLQAPFIGSGGTPPPPPPPGVPATPTGLTASPGNGQVALAWAPSAGAVSYHLFRGLASGAEGSAPRVTGITGTAYTDTGLVNGTAYYYQVAAVNAAGSSAVSAEARAIPAPAPTGGAYTVKPVTASNGPWFGEIDLQGSATAPITALTATITVRKTAGLSYSGMYNTLGSQIIQSDGSTSTTVVYSFALAPGQTLAAGSSTFAAQYGGTGTTHSTAGDTYRVAYSSGGQSFVLTGHF